MKVLVVDDSRFARKDVIFHLEDAGLSDLEIIQGENGKEAVELYEKERPDIVFMDLTMPVMDGVTALMNIKRRHPAALIYIVTADVQPKMQKRVLMLGAEQVIEKMELEDMLPDILKKFSPGEVDEL